jgi:hypothetical protein
MIPDPPIDRTKNLLPDIGPPAPITTQRGLTPGDLFAAGCWRVVNGALVLIPAPPGYLFNPRDGHPQ